MAIIAISGKLGSGKDLTGQIIQYLTSGNKKIRFDEYINLTNEQRNKYYSKWKIVKFADKLKDIVCLLLGCTREQLEDRGFKEKELGKEWWYIDTSVPGLPKTFSEYSYKNILLYGMDRIIKPTPRMILQQIGTDLFRNQLHPNCWITATMNDYVGAMKSVMIDDISGYYEGIISYPNWIITDVRFPNEADAVKSKNGINIRINRNYCNTSTECAGRLINGDNCEDCQYRPSTHISETALDDYKFDYIIDNNGSIDELVAKVKEILIKEGIYVTMD